jgi:2',3'-cyclic-nucleotide 2'-phosphodiesterase (5'-nucleotidase family)
VITQVSGRAILAALENGFSQLPKRSGRFPQISGLKVTISVAALPGSRVQSVLVNGESLDPSRFYRLATNDFMTRGGDGYAMLAGATHVTLDSGEELLARAVMDYAERLQTIAAKVEGRIVFI